MIISKVVEKGTKSKKRRVQFFFVGTSNLSKEETTLSISKVPDYFFVVVDVGKTNL
jgi:hypothetical protein